MRKKQFVIFVLLSLSSWAVVTYFLFLQRPLGNDKGAQLNTRLTKLEEELQDQFKSNDEFLSKLRQLISSQLSKNTETVKKTEEESKGNDGVVPGTGQNEENPKADNKVENEEDPIQQIANKLAQVEWDGPVIPVLVFACNRITVSRCLDQLIKYRPSKEQFPIVVSQDCDHQLTSDVIDSYGDQLIHIQQPDQSDIPVPPREKKFKGYFKIARHYGWALNQTFFKLNFDTVIIVEDDLDVSPDFFEYFLGTYPLLQQDQTLWCVSAWNDNGKAGLVDDNAPDLLYRTDFFPGLGWMLTKNLWRELSVKWPKAYWDDWVRQPEQRKGRACIRPEISRTRTFGKIGVSNGLFYEKHLKYIRLNEKFVPFTQRNVTYLLKDNYDVQFVKQVYDSPVLTYAELKSDSAKNEGSVRIQYHTKDVYKRTAKMLGLMDDFRSGIPRTGYRGVVSFTYKERRVFLAPNANWKGYDPSWS